MRRRLTSIFIVFSFFLIGASCDLSSSLFDTDEAPRETLPEPVMEDLVSGSDNDPSYDEETAVHIDITGRTEPYKITEEGTYIIEGTSESNIEVDAKDEDKIHLVLRGCTIESAEDPAIDIVNADKVFITLDEGMTNTLSITENSDSYTPEVIRSKDDLTLNGSGTVNITSPGNGITCKDEVVITGGTYHIDCGECAIKTETSVVVTNADINISSCYDGIHAENEEDLDKGFIVITGGTVNITAQDDCIHATRSVTITGGDFDMQGSECIESTYVKIEDGTFLFYATGDGINAGRKTKALFPTIEISGGEFTIDIAQGDTDGIDSNGDLLISGGSFDITAASPFDWDGELTCTGGSFTVNGEVITTLTNHA